MNQPSQTVIRESPTGKIRAEVFVTGPADREVVLVFQHGPNNTNSNFLESLDTLADTDEVLGCPGMSVSLPSGRRARITFEPAPPHQPTNAQNLR